MAITEELTDNFTAFLHSLQRSGLSPNNEKMSHKFNKNSETPRTPDCQNCEQDNSIKILPMIDLHLKLQTYTIMNMGNTILLI